MNQQQNQINLNFHPKRLIALAVAAAALIFMFLPWASERIVGGNSSSSNGFRSVGFLTLVGIVGVIISSILGDKVRDYDKNMKMFVMGSFGAIALGAIIYLIIVSAGGGNVATLKKQYAAMGYEYKASAGIGVWLTIVAGLAGLALVSGILNQFTGGIKSTSAAPPFHSSTPPIPPAPGAIPTPPGSMPPPPPPPSN